METTDQATGVDPMQALMGALGNGEPVEETTDQATGEEETTAEPTEQTEPEASAPADDDVQIVDFDNKKLEIPKGTPPALVEGIKNYASDLKAHFTKVTQEVAEIRKVSEARLDAIQKQEALFTANAPKVAKFEALRERVQEFEQLDWNALAEADPAQATKLHIAYQAAQRAAGAMYREIQESEKQRLQAESTAKEKARELARLELQKRIPKLDDKARQSMIDAAQRIGATEAHMYDPVFLEALHKAAQWDRLQAEKPKALQKVAEAPKVLKPGAAEQRKPNQAAFDRLKKHGRVEDLAALL